MRRRERVEGVTRRKCLQPSERQIPPARRQHGRSNCPVRPPPISHTRRHQTTPDDTRRHHQTRFNQDRSICVQLKHVKQQQQQQERYRHRSLSTDVR